MFRLRLRLRVRLRVRAACRGLPIMESASPALMPATRPVMLA
jgi:hypothetical protein